MHATFEGSSSFICRAALQRVNEVLRIRDVSLRRSRFLFALITHFMLLQSVIAVNTKPTHLFADLPQYSRQHPPSAFSDYLMDIDGDKQPFPDKTYQDLKRAERNWEKLDPNCPVYKNEALHAVMDRVCEMCHEMFSHEQSSFRAECRENCFRNAKFRGCLELFSPA
ncbi:hypothetical protein AB6A40_003737 [Gnathostoma spinigerum]|uniref:Uncharacterized protein n=1 Tax=Gnathostoma spinigerum TaxID=75299 RepID=A0ABD6EAK3_9BILA